MLLKSFSHLLSLGSGVEQFGVEYDVFIQVEMCLANALSMINVDFDVVSRLVNVHSIVHVEVPLAFNWDRELVVDKVHDHVECAKSSTCRRNSTRWSLNVPEYRQGSWTVGVSPISQSILSACFSQRGGDSG